MNNITIARAIAEAAIASVAPHAQLFVEDSHDTAYEGVLIARVGLLNFCVHVYLCDDDAGSEIWMIDASNHFTGEVDPRPLTAKGLEEGIKLLLNSTDSN